MADDSRAVADLGETLAIDGTSEAAAGNKGGSFMLVAVALVVMSASIGGTFTFVDDVGTELRAEQRTTTPVALYHQLRPAFIVNYFAGNKPRYLQAELTVVAREQTVVDSVVTCTPVIRSEILNLFAEQDFASLQTEGGKQALRSLLKERIDDVLVREKQEPGVESVMLTSFVMQ